MLSHMLRAAAGLEKITILGSNDGIGLTSVTVNTPSVVSGNLLLFFCGIANNNTTALTIGTPSGWTLLTGVGTTLGTAFLPGMYVFYRVADGTESASYTASSSTGRLSGQIIALRGANSATLTNGTTNTGNNTTSITATTVTANAGGLVFYCGMQANNNQGAVTFTAPTGMTTLRETKNTASAFTDTTFYTATLKNVPAGATGSKTATASSNAGTDYYRAILVTVGP
jgi:hypothetical protein